MKRLSILLILFTFSTALGLNRPLGDEAFKQNVSFTEGSGKLSLEQQISLIKLVQGLEKRGADLNISIAAWSDKEATSSEDNDLDEDQRELADQRLMAVKKYIKEIGFFGTISSYNMSETKSEELSSVEGSDAKLLKEKIDLLKSKGGLGKVSLIITNAKKVR